MYLGTPGPVPKREKLVRSPSWRDALRTMPCFRCRKPNQSTVSHIRIDFYTRGQKPGDDEALPMCMECHEEQERSHRKFFADMGVDDPKFIARGAYKVFKAVGALEAERFIFGVSHD